MIQALKTPGRPLSLTPCFSWVGLEPAEFGTVSTVLTHPNGTPHATLTQGPFATGWKASSLSRSGVWDLGQSGQVSLAVPNFGGALAWKYVQVQVTYLDAPGFFLAPATSIAGATLL